MKATLQFNLDDPDDRMAHFRCVKSLDMALVLFEILENTKKNIAFNIEGNNISDPYEVLDLVMEKIWEDARAHNVNTDELIN